MTTNLYRVATFVDGDVWLKLNRKVSTPGVFITVSDGSSEGSFSYSQANLDLLITDIQNEGELLKVNERRQAPDDHPHRAGCAAIRVDNAPRFISPSYHWLVYRGLSAGIWASDAEVADWDTIK